jgi:SprT protein
MARLEECKKTIEECYNVKLAFPTVEYKNLGRTAGRAFHSQNLIRLHPVLLVENVETFLHRTVAHELAHLAVRKIWGTVKSHGDEFKKVMRLLGAPTSACHNYDTTRARRKVKRYVYTCNCDGLQHHLAHKSHTNYIAGHRNYICRHCRASINYMKVITV